MAETMTPVAGESSDGDSDGADGGDDIILQMDDVVAGYGSTAVLHGTDLRVPRNAISTVIGPNGAGKSTALKAIFGMLKVRSGHIRYDGEDLAGRTQVELLQRGISYVPQGRNIFPRMTVRANLELGGVSLHDLSLTRRRMDEIAFDLFPVLRDKADAQAGNLSGGEQKMLEIGRAMLLEPRLLLVDEPSVGLSPILVRQVFSLLRDLRDRGVTVLMVEQNAKRALETSDYGMVLQQGRLALAGSAAEVLEHPEIGHLFLGGAMRVADR